VNGSRNLFDKARNAFERPLGGNLLKNIKANANVGNVSGVFTVVIMGDSGGFHIRIAEVLTTSIGKRIPKCETIHSCRILATPLPLEHSIERTRHGCRPKTVAKWPV